MSMKLTQRALCANQCLKVWYDHAGMLRASVYVPVEYRRSFLSSLPDWLERAGIWTGCTSRWGCLFNPDYIKDPYPSVRLYLMLVEALALSFTYDDLPY